MEEINEISLKEIVMILWNKIWVILGCILLGGIVSFAVTHVIIAPKYTSKVSMYVNNNTQKTDASVNINDITASQKLVNTYLEILKSEVVLTKVMAETKLPFTTKEIRNMMSANAINGTEIFEVKVTTTDASESALIANTIAKVAPNEIIRVVKAGSVELIDQATPAKEPSSPNTLLNTVIGMMLGAMGSVAGVFLAELLDNRIKTEEDIEKHYQFPVLAMIPDSETSQMSK